MNLKGVVLNRYLKNLSNRATETNLLIVCANMMTKNTQPSHESIIVRIRTGESER